MLSVDRNEKLLKMSKILEKNYNFYFFAVKYGSYTYFTGEEWKKWFVGLAALLTVLFFMPTATPQAATKNTTTWKVKVNEKYSGTLTLDGTQWYLNCSKVNFKRLNYLRRIVHLQTPKGCKITTGYYYFNTQGRLDRRRTFHDLDTRIGSTRFKGTYCFGEVNGRLHQQYGWYRVGGVNYGIGPTGKLPWHPEEKRSVRTEQLRQRLVCLCKRLKDQHFIHHQRHQHVPGQHHQAVCHGSYLRQRQGKKNRPDCQPAA